MSQNVTLFLSVLLFTSNIYSQWLPVNTFPKKDWFNSVFFTDDDHGWVAGDSGTILKFNPEKFCWDKIPSGTNESLKSVAFFDNQNGIAAGENGTLLISGDGGNSWSKSTIGTSENINKVFLLNETTGWFCGDKGTLFKTTDKGLNWSKINISTELNLNALCFVSENKGFVGGDSARLFLTNNGGKSWKDTLINVNEAPDVVSIFSITFTDSLNGFVGGGSPGPRIPYSIKTTDGGLTWSDSYKNYGSIRGMHFKDPKNGIMVGGNNSWDKFLAVVIDSVKSSVLFHEEDYDIMSCCITPSGHGWAVGGCGSVFYANDFSKSNDWGQIFVGGQFTTTSFSLYKGDFTIAGSRYTFRTPVFTIQKKMDKYNTFKDVNTFDLADNGVSLSMTDSLNGYIIVYSIYKTTDGGYSWNDLGQNSLGFHFLNNKLGWSFNSSAISKTTDGGLSWNDLYSPDFTITDIQFVNSQTGYACGTTFDDLTGKIIKTTDGGVTWSLLNIAVQGHLTALSFINADTGAVVGWGNTLLVTYNGGLSWTISQSSQKTETVALVSENRIPLKGDKRYILHKQTGSLYKETRVLTTGNYLDVVFRDNNVYVASDSNYILSSSDYGKNFNKVDTFNEPILQIETDGINYGARSETNLYLFKNEKPTTIVADESRPESFILNQNYPNPFNSSTKISYYLPAGADIKLEIFTVLGEKISTLTEEKQPAGFYSKDFNTLTNNKNLSSGIYLYRMTATEESGGRQFSSTKKMVLLK